MKDFWQWYNDKVNSIAMDSHFVWIEGEKFSTNVYGINNKIVWNGQEFHMKSPHSRLIKTLKLKHGCDFNEKLYNKDNVLSTATELAMMRKYRDFGMLSADYSVAFDGKDWFVFSPNVFRGYLNYYTLYDLMKFKNEPFDCKQIKKTYYYSFYQVISKKKAFLKFMTEECYDEYVKFLLSSVFEFSDDEHTLNIIFCKDKDSFKLEHIFVFDKESNFFNPLIACNERFARVKELSSTNIKYHGRSYYCPGEDFADRCNYLRRLIEKGKIPHKYVEFLRDVASYNYDKLFDETYDVLGVKKNDMQVDMFKFGAETAGNLTLLEK